MDLANGFLAVIRALFSILSLSLPILSFSSLFLLLFLLGFFSSFPCFFLFSFTLCLLGSFLSLPLFFFLSLSFLILFVLFNQFLPANPLFLNSALLFFLSLLFDSSLPLSLSLCVFLLLFASSHALLSLFSPFPLWLSSL